MRIILIGNRKRLVPEHMFQPQTLVRYLYVYLMVVDSNPGTVMQLLFKPKLFSSCKNRLIAFGTFVQEHLPSTSYL